MDIPRGGFRGNAAVQVVVDVQGDPNLMEVVQTPDAVRRFPGVLDGRHQQADKDADNRDHDHQLQQRKTAMGSGGVFAAKTPPDPVRQSAP